MIELSSPLPIFRTALGAPETLIAAFALSAVAAQQTIDVARYNWLHFEGRIDFGPSPATRVDLEVSFSRDRVIWHQRTVESVAPGPAILRQPVIEEFDIAGDLAFVIQNFGAQFMRVRARGDLVNATLLLHVLGQRPAE